MVLFHWNILIGVGESIQIQPGGMYSMQGPWGLGSGVWDGWSGLADQADLRLEGWMGGGVDSPDKGQMFAGGTCADIAATAHGAKTAATCPRTSGWHSIDRRVNQQS